MPAPPPALLAISLGIASLAAQSVQLTVARSAVSPRVLRGAALSADRTRLYTWGDGLYVWDIGSMNSKRLAKGSFGEGGCLLDIDHDGHDDLIVQSGDGLGKLIWFNGRTWRQTVIDSGIEMHDCLGFTLLGHRGVLMVQRGMQVRFYTEPSKGHEKWGYREIYSFYTPSKQAGLIS